MCSQQQSPPGPQLSTLHDPPQSDKMPLPVRVGKLEVKSYIQSWETDQYIAFTKEETRYFESEYSSKKKLGKGKSGVVYLATRKSDGMEVAYKSIPKSKTRKYASESNTFTRCHLRNPIVRSKKPSVEQCMSPRPPDPLVPYEFMIQRYLSRPGYKNPYVSVVFDYFILESEYIVVMEYCDEQWENLAKYVRERIRLDIENARNIVREIVNAMISLKRHGVVHNYLTVGNVMYNPRTGKIKLIDFGVTNVLPEWEEGKSLPLNSSDPPSPVSKSEAGDDEVESHYGSLAADTTGHSLDLQYWHDRQPIQVSRDTLTIRNSDILDQDFSWNQIVAALLQMSPRKAPGDDGITTAFYQAALYMPANTQEGVPPTPFARALLRVCGQVFASATIPRAWLCASIVSIDKKYGDPLNPGDKRGIALINVGLKLVCNVLQMRIERFAETKNLLSYEQAGLRKREECVGQVVSPVDIIQRRQNAGLNTHVLFIDIRKAFDTVTVGALLWKLQNMGFPRRTLAFLKALYTFSSARARAGSLLSDPFPVQRGVRQGCPLSGLLFNLFINDILDGVAPITVPGLPRDQPHPRTHVRRRCCSIC
ncbi:hypothetical protein BASA62_007533 [Batrachochytrium salamandrivorans]|nr:hypothetical protein BASA62_007533 [Batrachochytrium salamandrivorans]